MVGTRSRRDRQTATLQPQIKIWLESKDGSGFCHGMCAILQAVERTGSIKHAANELGKSYRHIWGRIKAAENVVGRKLVETHIGGKDAQRSLLTADAQELVSQILAVGDRIAQVLGEEFARRFR